MRRARAVRRAPHRTGQRSRAPARRSADAGDARGAGRRLTRALRAAPGSALPGRLTFPPMAFADDFQAVVESLPPDWTNLELDMRIDDEDRYVEAATLLTQINAIPYSEHDWHWRLR